MRKNGQMAPREADTMTAQQKLEVLACMNGEARGLEEHRQREADLARMRAAVG